MPRLSWVTLLHSKFLPMSAVLSLHVTCLPANQPPAGFLPRSLHGSFHSHCRPLTSELDSSAQTLLISASMFCPLWIAHTVSAGWHTRDVISHHGPFRDTEASLCSCAHVTCDIPQHLQHVPLPVTLSLAVSCPLSHTFTSCTFR